MYRILFSYFGKVTGNPKPKMISAIDKNIFIDKLLSFANKRELAYFGHADSKTKKIVSELEKDGKITWRH